MMTIRLIYKGVVVDETQCLDNHTIHSVVGYLGLIETCMSKFGVDLSQYRLSDMKRTVGQIEFSLKEEDYIKLRDNKINKILD